MQTYQTPRARITREYIVGIIGGTVSFVLVYGLVTLLFYVGGAR